LILVAFSAPDMGHRRDEQGKRQNQLFEEAIQDLLKKYGKDKE